MIEAFRFLVDEAIAYKAKMGGKFRPFQPSKQSNSKEKTFKSQGYALNSSKGTTRVLVCMIERSTSRMFSFLAWKILWTFRP